MKNVLTAASFISINVLTNVLGIIRAKLIAVLYGVAEIGLLGQLVTFFNLQTATSTFGTKVSLITLVGKTKGERRYGIIYSGILLLTVINILIFLLLYFFAPLISRYIFKSVIHQNIILGLAMIGPLLAIKEFLESVLQAEKKFRILATGKLAGIGAGLIAIGPLIYFYGILGVIIDFAVWFFAEILFLIFKQFRTGLFKFVYLRYIKDFFKPVLKISGLNIIRHLAIASALMLMRVMIIQLLDVRQAGYFQAVWGVANYMNILMAGFSFYFLPTINSFVNSDRFSTEIKANLSMLLHMILSVVLAIIIFPSLLLVILYSKEFGHLYNLLSWMAFGKVFEILYLFYIMILVAQDKLKNYISLELIRAILIILVPYLLISNFGLSGAVAGVVTVNVLILGILLISIRNDKLLMPNRALAVQLIKLAAAIILIIAIPYILLKVLISVSLFFFVLDVKNYAKIFTFLKKRKI